MVGDIHGVHVTDADVAEIRQAMLTMPGHPDVEEGLGRLKDAGFRLVTLADSPANPGGQSPLEHAGLAPFFERQFSIETVRSYKPARRPTTRSPRNWPCRGPRVSWSPATSGTPWARRAPATPPA
jgi:phosphoglycolate phosphatase-like HAD superfamily hydrolase